MAQYDNVILLGDFNLQPTDHEMIEFCNLYNLKNIVNDATCYKSQNNPSCIDLILTNKTRSFQNTRFIETGLSDFHKMTVTVLKTFFRKLPPKVVSYRNYKKFSDPIFRKEIMDNLQKYDISKISFEQFNDILMKSLDKHAPIRKKYVRINDCPFMTKELRKSIMKRSNLKNRFNKLKTEENRLKYNKQRNKCTLILRKAKKNYFNNLNPALITDNKKFWKIVKPLFSEKHFHRESIMLIEDDKIIEDNKQISEIFNNFFTNAVKNLNIQIDQNINNVEDIKDPILRAIKKI